MTAPQARSALVVIDFQNAVFESPAAHDASAVLQRIEALIVRARQASMPVVYVQHVAPDTVWEAGRDTWRFPESIAPRAGDLVSAKDSCDAFRGTDLERKLRESGIADVYVCGYATEFCIDTNVRRLAAMGFATTVVSDAHTTRDRPHLGAPAIIQHHEWVWREFGNPGCPIRVCRSDEIVFPGVKS